MTETGPYIGSYGALGYAKELTLGTPVAATGYVPFADVSLEKDPGMIAVKAARQQRELSVYYVPGEQKISGTLSFPLFAIMGMPLVVGAIGYDKYVTGSAPLTPTTLAGAAAAPATSISTAASFSASDVIEIDTGPQAETRTVTTVTGEGPYTVNFSGGLAYSHLVGATVAKLATAGTISSAAAAGAGSVASALSVTEGEFVQIGTAGNGNAEVHQVLSDTADTITFAAGETLLYAHSSGDAIVQVAAPFLHWIFQQNAVQSFTLEEDLGGLASIQWAGIVPSKLSIKGTTKTEAQVQLTCDGQSDTQIAPTTPSFSADQPFVLAGTQISALSAVDLAAESFELDVDNQTEPRWTYSGKRSPTYLPSKGRVVGFKMTRSLQDMSYYDALPSVTATTVVTDQVEAVYLVSGSDALLFSIPQGTTIKLSQPEKVGEVIMQDLSFQAFLGTNANSMTAALATQQWLPY